MVNRNQVYEDVRDLGLQRSKDDDKWRWYQDTAKRKYISVTTVLDVVQHQRLTSYFKKTDPVAIEKKRVYSADLGSRIHRAVEQDLKGEEVELSQDIELPFTRWQAMKAAHGIKPFKVEMMVASKTLGVAGQLDVFGEFEGRPCVMDLKTSKYSIGIKTGWQIAAYKYALEEMGGFKDLGMVGLHVKSDGTLGKPFVYEHLDFCLQRFLCALECFKGLYFRKLNDLEWPWLKTFSPEVLHEINH